MDTTRDRGVTAAPAHDNSEPRRHVETGELSWHTDPTRGPITLDVGVSIMRIVTAVRPDWHPTAVMVALDELRHEHPAKLTTAALRVAETPGSVPATIALVGPHWEDTPAPRAVSPVAVKMCREHPKTPARDCQPCKDKRKRPSWFWDTYQNEAEKDAARREQLKAQQEEAERQRQERLTHL